MESIIFRIMDLKELHQLEEEIEQMSDAKERKARLELLEQIMEKIYKDVVYVPLPEKQAAAREFLEEAIAISNAYEVDIKIRQYFERIEVKYYFDCAVSVGFLKEILVSADEISFFKDDEGFNLALSLDFYTHAIYRKERCIIP